MAPDSRPQFASDFLYSALSRTDCVAFCRAGVRAEPFFRPIAVISLEPTLIWGVRTVNAPFCCFPAHGKEVGSYRMPSIRLEASWVKASWTLGSVTALIAG